MGFQISQVLIDDSSDKTISGVQIYDRDNGGTFVVPAGTAFPGSPVGGELFWRTDISSLYRRDDGNAAWAELSVNGATLDHGLLQGLGDDDHTQYQLESEKDSVSGYAGLNASSRTIKGVDTQDDVIIDLATKGLVLKDTQATPHYWRVTIDNAGALITTDLGTTKP